MHGLSFETSICYWQDQPGSRHPSGAARRRPDDGGGPRRAPRPGRLGGAWAGKAPRARGGNPRAATADPGGRPFPRRRGQGAGTAAQLSRQAASRGLAFLSLARPRAHHAAGRGSAGADPPPKPARPAGRRLGRAAPPDVLEETATRRGGRGPVPEAPSAGAARSAAGGGAATRCALRRYLRAGGASPRAFFFPPFSLSPLSGSPSRLRPHRRPALLAAGTHGRHPDPGRHRHLACFYPRTPEKLAGPRGRHTARYGEEAPPRREGRHLACHGKPTGRGDRPARTPASAAPLGRPRRSAGPPGALSHASRKASSIVTRGTAPRPLSLSLPLRGGRHVPQAADAGGPHATLHGSLPARQEAGAAGRPAPDNPRFRPRRAHGRPPQSGTSSVRKRHRTCRGATGFRPPRGRRLPPERPGDGDGEKNKKPPRKKHARLSLAVLATAARGSGRGPRPSLPDSLSLPTGSRLGGGRPLPGRSRALTPPEQKSEKRKKKGREGAPLRPQPGPRPTDLRGTQPSGSQAGGAGPTARAARPPWLSRRPKRREGRGAAASPANGHRASPGLPGDSVGFSVCRRGRRPQPGRPAPPPSARWAGPRLRAEEGGTNKRAEARRGRRLARHRAVPSPSPSGNRPGPGEAARPPSVPGTPPAPLPPGSRGQGAATQARAIFGALGRRPGKKPARARPFEPRPPTARNNAHRRRRTTGAGLRPAHRKDETPPPRRPRNTIAFARGPRGAGSRHRLGLDAAVGPPAGPPRPSQSRTPSAALSRSALVFLSRHRARPRKPVESPAAFSRRPSCRSWGLPRKCRQAPKSRRSRVDLVALRRDAAGAEAAGGGRGGRIGRLRNRVYPPGSDTRSTRRARTPGLPAGPGHRVYPPGSDIGSTRRARTPGLPAGPGHQVYPPGSDTRSTRRARTPGLPAGLGQQVYPPGSESSCTHRHPRRRAQSAAALPPSLRESQLLPLWTRAADNALSFPLGAPGRNGGASAPAEGLG
ncbi:collagen alpha-1(I) chain-like [Pseudopipra pipra]|uniref:collagen alpha-1(I) chain-like n=1 Tax=Pseudopipra pipra TaxID=415032 RepID=UPI00313992A6